MLSGIPAADQVKLLTPEVEKWEPETYYSFIVGLYQPRSATGKQVEAKIHGKQIQTVTKKRNGKMELKFTTGLGEKSCVIEFSSERILVSPSVKEISEKILCGEEKLISFLLTKKITCQEAGA